MATIAALKRRMAKWTDGKLERELVFAELAAVEDHQESMVWLAACVAETARRMEAAQVVA